MTVNAPKTLRSMAGDKLSRRRVLGGIVTTAMASALMACSSQSPTTSSSAPTPAPAASTSAAPTSAPAAAATAPAAAKAPTTAPSTSASTAASSSVPGKTLVVAVEQDASSLKPDTWGPYLNWYAARCLYDTLVHYGVKKGPDGLTYYDDSSWEMHLASKVDISEDRQTVTWTMRDGVKFASGKPIDAPAVVKSFQWYLDRNEVGGGQAKVDGLVSRDAVSAQGNQVIMKLKFPAPWGAIANYISLLSIVDADEIMKHATSTDKFGAKWLERNATPSGAFTLDKWVPGEQMVVSARKDWYGYTGKTGIDRIIFQVVPDPSVRFSLLKRGQAQLVSVLDFKDLVTLKDDPNIVTDSWVGNDWTYIGLNWNQKEFQDKNVRKAIATAIPTADILNTVYYGFAVPSKTPFGSRVIGSDPSTWPYTYNVDQAKQYMAKSGYPSGFPVTFSIPNNDVSQVKSSQLIADALGKIGIKVNIEQQTSAQNSDALVAKKLAMSITDFVSFVPDAGYHALWNHLPDSYANYFDYKNPEQEKIGRQMLYMDPNDPKRIALLKQYQQIMADDVFAVYFATVKAAVTHHKNLSGFAYYPDTAQVLRFDNLTLK